MGEINNIHNMRCSRIEGVVLVATIFLVCSLNWAGNVQAPGVFTIEVIFDKSEVNISQASEPLTFHGWVNFTGLSITPFVVHMDSDCNVGESILSQYEFVFRLPESVPFDTNIYIAPETENDTLGEVIIAAYYTEGGVQYEAPPIMHTFTVLNYNESETIDESQNNHEITQRNENGGNSPLICLPILMIAFGTMAVFVKKKMMKRKDRLRLRVR